MRQDLPVDGQRETQILRMTFRVQIKYRRYKIFTDDQTHTGETMRKMGCRTLCQYILLSCTCKQCDQFNTLRKTMCRAPTQSDTVTDGCCSTGDLRPALQQEYRTRNKSKPQANKTKCQLSSQKRLGGCRYMRKVCMSVPSPTNSS